MAQKRSQLFNRDQPGLMDVEGRFVMDCPGFEVRVASVCLLSTVAAVDV